MDKLRPILEQKFWILSVIALLLVITGWWMGTGSLLAEYNEREKVLNAMKVPTGNSANDDWNNKMTEVVDLKDERLQETTLYLTSQQQGNDVKFWTGPIATHMKGKAFLEDLDIYRTADYVNGYDAAIIQMRDIVRPFDFETGKGQCDLDIATLPQGPKEQWDLISPTSDEVWYSQMDVWLTSALLRAIADTNGQAKGILKAPVKRIATLELHGGKRKPDGTPDNGRSAATQVGGGIDDGVYVPGDDQPEAGDMRLGGGGGFGRGAETGATGGAIGVESVDFSPSEALGLAAVPQTGNMSDPSGNINSNQGNNQKVKVDASLGLYVDNDPKMPFKTRGFYLKVVMNRTKLPELLAQLTTMKYPVEIVHVNQASFKSNSARGTQRATPRMGAPAGAFSPFEAQPAGADAGFNANQGGEFGQPGGVQRNAKDDEHTQEYNRAFRDPQLSEVVIVGIMYMYNTPEESKKDDEK